MLSQKKAIYLLLAIKHPGPEQESAPLLAGHLKEPDILSRVKDKRVVEFFKSVLVHQESSTLTQHLLYFTLKI